MRTERNCLQLPLQLRSLSSGCTATDLLSMKVALGYEVQPVLLGEPTNVDKPKLREQNLFGRTGSV